MARRKYRDEWDADDREMEETPEKETDQKQMETSRKRKRNGIVSGTPLLRVREQPTTKSDVVKVLQEGDSVKILDIAENNFYKIELGKDEVGYIVSTFCKEV